MTTTYLQTALEIIQYYLGRGGSGQPRTAITFDAGAPSVPITQLATFSDTVDRPTMRRCCVIGPQPAIGMLPYYFATDAMGMVNLGPTSHLYGGPSINPLSSNFAGLSADPVGHIYTGRGGIIDVAHARDHADLARYLAVQVRAGLQNGWNVDLTDEAGTRVVKLKPNGFVPDAELCALLGARISYDVAIWHEIVTWASTGLRERQLYSAFSPEDNYSNLLGAYLGYLSVLTPGKKFNQALSENLLSVLLELGAVPRLATEVAIDYVRDHWYTYSPDDLELLRRHFNAQGTITPWLVTDLTIAGKESLMTWLHQNIGQNFVPTSITAPTVGPLGEALAPYYSFEIDVSAGSIPPAFFDGRTTITSADFPGLIAKVKAEVLAIQPNGDQRE